jgi:antitoxin VapB
MGSLNIKDPEAHRLATAISNATGETLTAVVTTALRERFKRIQTRKSKATAEELMAIARRASSHVRGSYVDHGALLYDELGLPK